MDSIVTTALVGTARQGGADSTTGTPTDALIGQLPEIEAERKLLLSAGARAIYRQAGQRPRRIVTAPEPARTETLRDCSPGATLLLSRLLNGEQAVLLPEALAQLRESGMHLPYQLLPLALSKTGKEYRASLFPVLGERGLWLSQFNSAWNWVNNYLPANESSLPADAEAIWQEGSVGQRVEVLRRLRVVDADKAREWLETAWKQEKAEVRNELLDTLGMGLGSADEGFLEKALDDRAASVRLAAAHLLMRIPTSAFVERMCARGSSMLRRAAGLLDLELPRTYEKEWQRDGIVENPPAKFGKRAWWLVQIVGTIPPAFWESHLGAKPEELLQMFPESTWQMNVVDGWSRAAVNHNTSTWLLPLWNWWQEHPITNKPVSDDSVREHLFKRMPWQESEQVVQTLLHAGKNGVDNGWQDFLPELPRPWSVEFGGVCLRVFYDYFETRLVQTLNANSYTDIWLDSLPILALALPAACLTEATDTWKSWNLPEEQSTWQIAHARQTVDAYIETIQMRQKIYKEIM